MSRTFVLVLACAGTSLALPAQADFINEPSSAGLGAVNITGVARNPSTGIYAISGPVFDATGRQLQIGYSSSVPGGTASLTLNNEVGTYDVVGISGLSLTYVGGGVPGSLTVDGAGAFIESGTTWFGLGNASDVRILNGGRFSGERTFVALDDALDTAPGDATVLVDGPGSIWETETVTIGSSDVATSARAEVVVSGGGTLSAARTPGASYSNGQIYVGGSLSHTQDDLLRVTGSGSLAEASDYMGVGSLAGNDRLEVLDGGRVEVGLGQDGGTGPGSPSRVAIGANGGTATAFVSGAGSTLDSGDSIQIGFGPVFTDFEDDEFGEPDYDKPLFAPADGVAIVENGGTIRAADQVRVGNGAPGVNGTLIVNSGGIVEADEVVVSAGGLLGGNGGTILGDVIANGGTIAPGSSPGTLTVDGDLTLNDSLLTLEIGGTGPGEYDVLDVTGNLFADSMTRIVFELIGGFTPGMGDVFDIFRVGGSTDIAAAKFEFRGFGAGLDTTLFSTEGGLSLSVAGVTEPAPVPLPAGAWMLLAGLGLLGARRLA